MPTLPAVPSGTALVGAAGHWPVPVALRSGIPWGPRDIPPEEDAEFVAAMENMAVTATDQTGVELAKANGKALLGSDVMIRRGHLSAPIATSQIDHQLAQGRQAYIVYPVIEESEKLELQTAVALHAELTAALPEFTVGLLHGDVLTVTDPNSRDDPHAWQ